jgi:3-oxoacyl-[acyl-carrier-protein] synthase-3
MQKIRAAITALNAYVPEYVLNNAELEKMVDTNGTISLCLNDWESKLKKGDNLILAAFGGGFTWGSVYLKWAY